MKSIFFRWWLAFLFGLGAFISFNIGLIAVTNFRVALMDRDRLIDRIKDPEGLEIVSQREIPNSSNFTNLVTVRNSGSLSWESVDVRAEFFDEANNKTNACTKTSHTGVVSGGEINFKVVCGSSGCCDAKFPKYNHYKLRVSGAKKISRPIKPVS